MFFYTKSLDPVLHLQHISIWTRYISGTIDSDILQLVAAILDSKVLYYSHIFTYSSNFPEQSHFACISPVYSNSLGFFSLNYCI